ncbi:MAG: DUF177 domain-containing protein [Pseudomonadota bacterium]
MSKKFLPASLHVQSFAQVGATLDGADSLQNYERLSEELQRPAPDRVVNWSAVGELRSSQGGEDQVWLHLKAATVAPLACQRCLDAVDVPLAFDRSFRFVADEATAEALDDGVEEDLLALSTEFDLLGLIEDELLMELPVVPRHDLCPTELPHLLQPGATAQGTVVDELGEKPNPFAVLAKLRTGKLN